MELTHFSLFSGIGGLDLAAELAGSVKKLKSVLDYKSKAKG